MVIDVKETKNFKRGIFRNCHFSFVILAAGKYLVHVIFIKAVILSTHTNGDSYNKKRCIYIHVVFVLPVQLLAERQDINTRVCIV